MATTLHPKPIPPFLKTPSSPPSLSKSTNLPFSATPSQNQHFSTKKFTTNAKNKKKNQWLDPFNDGDDEDREFGSLYSEGLQEEDPRPPDNPDNPYGFLKFPMGFMVEVASLGLMIRGDIRRCCCVVSGGVYENLLFFPTIQLIKNRYPGVQIDVITSARGKQTYELNKNVRWADAYDIEDPFPEPVVYTDMIGTMKKRYYDAIFSTKLAGIGHAAFLYMSTARDVVSYIYPNVNSAGAGLLLTQSFTPDGLNLSDGGFNMYHQMTDWIARPGRKVPRQAIPPLKVAISKKLKEVVETKYTNAGVQKGKYIVIHGIKADSEASMQSRGDTDSLLPIEIWDEIASVISGLTPVFVIPHEKVREDVEEVVGDDASIVFITTPGQLAALINDSAGVIATNTAAIQLAKAREIPSVALFCSQEKAKVFVPNPEENKCAVISSKTGKLIDIDIEAVKTTVQILTMPRALVMA